MVLAAFLMMRLNLYFASCFIAIPVTKESAFIAAAHSESITIILKYAGCSEYRHYPHTGLVFA